MIPCQRALFDIPDDVAYLNCAYMSPLMHAVAEAGKRGIDEKRHPWTVGSEDFFTLSEETRGLFGQMVGADADSIAIVPAASYGVATAAANLPLKAGDEVLVLDEQFPSNIYSWQRLTDEAGASLITVTKEGDCWTDAVLAQISNRTRIAALPHCHWTDGALLDLVRISKRLKEVGAALVLDLSQSAGALPINMSDVDPDFAVAVTYKWMMGPYSLGFLYVAPRHRQGRALEENWIVRKGSENFAGLVDYETAYQPGARRFDMGERANFQLMPMAHAALTQLLDWGVENIADTLRARTDDIAARAEALGLTAAPRALRAPHFLGLRFLGAVPDGLLQSLAAEQVYVSLRGTSMRVTPHLYNNDADVDRLFAALEKLS